MTSHRATKLAPPGKSAKSAKGAKPVVPVLATKPAIAAKASKASQTVYSHRYRQPGWWNSLKFRVSLLPLFNPMSEFPMSTTRRNVLIRSIAGLCGDIAVGVAVASVCVWIIEAAALGLFLSFLLWLLTAMASLALSQLVVHPTVTLLLSDRKLDAGMEAVAGLADGVNNAGGQLMGLAKSSWSRRPWAT